MEPEKIHLLKGSWDRVQDHGPALAESFYDRLFHLAPRLRDLFTITEMNSQNEKFLLMMSEMVRYAGDPDRLVELLRASGRRHQDYGVVARDYMTVGEAFLWALDHALPDGLSEDERDAWAEAYTFMSSVMRSGTTH
jgi:hemoglobin-like flavoprotein